MMLMENNVSSNLSINDIANAIRPYNTQLAIRIKNDKGNISDGYHTYNRCCRSTNESVNL